MSIPKPLNPFYDYHGCVCSGMVNIRVFCCIICILGFVVCMSLPRLHSCVMKVSRSVLMSGYTNLVSEDCDMLKLFAYSWTLLLLYICCICIC